MENNTEIGDMQSLNINVFKELVVRAPKRKSFIVRLGVAPDKKTNQILEDVFRREYMMSTASRTNFNFFSTKPKSWYTIWQIPREAVLA